jgi:hypothetical protein
MPINYNLHMQKRLACLQTARVPLLRDEACMLTNCKGSSIKRRGLYAYKLQGFLQETTSRFTHARVRPICL